MIPRAAYCLILLAAVARFATSQQKFVLVDADKVDPITSSDEGNLVLVDAQDVQTERETYVLLGAGEEEEYEYEEIAEGREFNVGYPTCDKMNDDGTVTSTLFDECTSFCCGGNVYLNQTGLDCCGSVYFGNPYFARVQTCCEWWTGHGKGHLKRRRSRWNYHNNIGCCGMDRVIWGQQSCCYGEGVPSVFNPRFEICCNGKSLPTRTQYSWQSSCCGSTASFDKRSQSCPCDDGSVIDLPAAYTECCESNDGYKNPYIRMSQICCNGNVGEADTDFCCGDMLGTRGQHVCCDGLLQMVNPPDVTMTDCCARQPYNSQTHLCCDGVLVEKMENEDACCNGMAISSDFAICCDGKVKSRELDGTMCCGAEAFFENTGAFCCNDVVMLIDAVDGDTCCGTGIDVQFYYEEENTFICCDGYLSMRIGDSCCGIISYDPKNSICCDGEVFDRTLGDTCCNGSPYFVSAPSANSKTICCENGAYGPFMTPACCNGVGYDIQGGQVCCSGVVFGIYRQPACCINIGYDVTQEQCCMGRLVANPEMSTYAQCCGESTFNPYRNLCCDGVVHEIPEGMSPSKATCCESSGIYDPTYQLCCQGKIYIMESRSRNRCCGDVMYDIKDNICCGEQDSLPELHTYQFGMDNTECCGRELYDSRKAFCCEGVLEENVYEQSGCCGGLLYNRKEQICCDDMLREIGKNVPWDRAACCGNKCYFPGPMRCCNNRIYMANMRTEQTCVDY